MDFPPSCFLCSYALRAESFFGLHLPAWSLDSCSVCQLVASGTLRRREFAGKKREGPVGPLQTRQVLSFTPTVLQHSTEKGFSFSLSCSFCSSCSGRNVGVKWPLLIMHGSCMQAFYIILEQSIY